jgi:hypothetical protein
VAAHTARGFALQGAEIAAAFFTIIIIIALSNCAAWKEHLASMEMLKDISDLRLPHEWYTTARAMRRRYLFFVLTAGRLTCHTTHG